MGLVVKAPLAFVQEAERKQQAYAARRMVHTTQQLKEFEAWQRALTQVRRRLLTLIHHRGVTRPGTT